jgi:hypothetical protein
MRLLSPKMRLPRYLLSARPLISCKCQLLYSLCEDRLQVRHVSHFRGEAAIKCQVSSVLGTKYLMAILLRLFPVYLKSRQGTLPLIISQPSYPNTCVLKLPSFQFRRFSKHRISTPNPTSLRSFQSTYPFLPNTSTRSIHSFTQSTILRQVR